MLKNIGYVILSVLLLSLPWLGGPAVTLFVGFVPLLMLQQARLKGFWIYVAATFFLWWLATTWWVGLSVAIGIIAVLVIGTALTAGAFMLYDLTLRKGTKPLAYTVFVAAWLAYEYLYLVGELSFPWLNLGNGFANSVKLIQWYEYTGTLGGSLWVLVTNLLIFEALKERKNIKKWIAPAVVSIVPAVWSLIVYYGYEELGETAKVTVVQPNIEPWFEKYTMDQEELDAIMMKLMLEAPDDVDFIVLPETVTDHVNEDYALGHSSVKRYRSVIRKAYPDAAVIAGAMTTKFYPSLEEASETVRVNEDSTIFYDHYNSALHIDSTDLVDIHHKSILVAGAEKMPFYRWTKNLDFLIVDLGGITGQYGVDTVSKVFTSHTGTRSGTAICYESVYGEYFGEFVRNGAQLMFVITNDGWWGNTSGHRQHFSYSRLRAVETRRSIARSANTGISGFVNQRGDVLQKLGWDVRGTLTDELTLNDKVTVYAAYGDYTGRLAWFVLVLCMLYLVSYRFRKKHHLEK